MKKNYPCECGHAKSVHKRLDIGEGSFTIEFICMVNGKETLVEDCSCNKYKPDNLKYLENRYEQQILTIKEN